MPFSARSVCLLRISRPDRAHRARFMALFCFDLNYQTEIKSKETRSAANRCPVPPSFDASEKIRVVVVWGSHMLCAFAAATVALVPQLPAHRVTGYASGISRTSDVQMINLFGNTGAQNHATEPCDARGPVCFSIGVRVLPAWHTCRGLMRHGAVRAQMTAQGSGKT